LLKNIKKHGALKEDIERWEKLTGRKLSKEEQIRIYGKLFSSSTKSSSISSSYGEPFGVILSIIISAVGASPLCAFLFRHISLAPVKMLRIFSYQAQKTSFTAGTLGEIHSNILTFYYIGDIINI